MYRSCCIAILLAGGGVSPAHAQRSDENAVVEADDAFGTSIGNENIGLYTPFEVRGFSAVDAGNVRIDGLYFDQQVDLNTHLVSGSTIRVGISAQGYPLPAPTGIVDYRFRRAGPEPIFSVYAGLGPYANRKLELDYQTPIGATELSIVGGATLERSRQGNVGFGHYANIGVAPRWAPGPDFEVIPFYSAAWSWDQEAIPLAFVNGERLPDRIDRSVDYSQDWADNRSVSSNMGLISRAQVGGFELRAGFFRSRSTAKRRFADLYFNVDEDNVGDHVVIADKGQFFGSVSGEIRLSRRFVIGGNPHSFYLIGRGREQKRRYGGFDRIQFGRAEIGVPLDLPEPKPVFGPQSHDRVQQFIGAVAYDGRPFDWLELSAGLQRASYRKDSLFPGASEPNRGRDEPWLYNAAAAINATSRLAFYASYSKGLEEGGVAPENASNRGAAAPALITRQVDAGLRYAFTDNFRLVAGLFDVRKPYYNLDQADTYRALGEFRQRGIETSLTGSPAKGLNIVAGMVLSQPRVRGEEVDAGLIGNRPIGQTNRLTIVSADYALPRLSGLSVNATMISVGRRVASADNRLIIPQRSTYDLGARYRFKLGKAPATLSMRLSNIFNKFGWRTNSSGVLIPSDRRRLSLSLAADF